MGSEMCIRDSTEDPTLSRLTLTTEGDDGKIEQITKHLNKLIEVVRVFDLTEGDHLEREIVMIKVRADGEARTEVKRTTDIFRGQIVDVNKNTYTIQLVGPSEKLVAFIDALGGKQVVEVVRSGVTGIGRGDRILGL